MNPDPENAMADAPGPSARPKSGFSLASFSLRRRRLLQGVLLGSLGLHLLGMLIFGGIKLVQYFTETATVFEVPPPAKTYEPRKVELKVKVQRRQRSSSRPAVVPRMVSSRPAQLAFPEIKIDPKLVTTTFQPKFKAVSGKGLGAGLGTGYGASGFGEGVSSINFFDIQTRGERIALLVDVSVSMVEEDRGGPAGFNRVRERINQVVKSLKDGTLFSVIVFADACSVMSSKMVYASNETRVQARQFLAGFNVAGRYGLESGNYTPGNVGLRASGGTTRLDLALSAAMGQLADTILIISDGLPEVVKPADPAAMDAYRQQLSQWRSTHAGAIRTHEEAVASAPERRVWVPPQPARPPSKGVLKEGVRPDPGAPAREGYWRTVRDVPAGPQAPPPPQAGRWSLADFIQHMSLIYDAEYKPKSLKEPQVNCIGYQINRDGGDFLNGLARRYKGQYRLVRKLR
jgi:hypothetical protein